MEDKEQTNGVTVTVSGNDPGAVGLAASAVNYGLVECGFENVSIAVPEGVVCHQADNNLMAIMRKAKESDPDAFQVEADIIIVVGDDDEEPDESDVPPPRANGDDELEVEIE